MGAQGTALGGANMWALLLDKDPGHSAAAGDLAVDVVDRKLKKAALVKVEKAPPAGNVAKPANRAANANKNRKGAVGSSMQVAASKRGDRVNKMKKVATGCSKPKQATSNLASSSAAIVDGVGKVKINGAAGDNKQTAATDGKELTNTLIRRYFLPEETGKKEEQEFAVVAARGGRRRTVATRTPKAATAQAQGVAATGANMWALLGDEDTGHSDTTEVEEAPPADNVGGTNDLRSGQGGGANPAKRGKKTNTKTKKQKHEKTPAAPPCKVEEVTSEEAAEMSGEVATGIGGCRTVASCLWRAAVVVAFLGLYCRLEFS